MRVLIALALSTMPLSADSYSPSMRALIEPAKYKNKSEHAILLDGKETAVRIYRRLGDIGQIYEVNRARRKCGKDIYLYYRKCTNFTEFTAPTLILNMNTTTVLREIEPLAQPDAIDPEATSEARADFLKTLEAK